MARELVRLVAAAVLVGACGGDFDGSGNDGTGDNGTGDNGAGDNGTGDNGTGDNGTGDPFGALHECYGIADDLGEVFAIDRATGQATHICSVPAEVAEIDAISSHPTTGVYYYVSQSSAELGWFDPDTCDFNKIGDIDVTKVAGLSFHPETAVLYAGDQDTKDLYRFGQDAEGAPTPELTLVASLPVTPKAIAIEPGTSRVFVSDAVSLATYDLESGEAGQATSMSSERVEAIFFTVDGSLHGVVDAKGEPPDRFVDVDQTSGSVSDVGGLNPVAYLPGSTARPEADDVEAMECNVGGACVNCQVD